MSKEAMKLALDFAIMHHTDAGYTEVRYAVQAALREALAEQPAQQQEPNGLPPCWYIEYARHGAITMRKDEADKAIANGAIRVTAYSHAAPVQQEPLQRYSPDGEGGMEIDSLGAWVKFTSPQPASAQVPVGTYGEIYQAIRELLQSGKVEDQQIYLAMKDKLLYTSPPAQRTWVGLSDAEIDKTYETKVWDARRSYARAIEAKLKEKNQCK